MLGDVITFLFVSPQQSKSQQYSVYYHIKKEKQQTVPIAAVKQQQVQLGQLLSKGIRNVITRNKCLRQPDRERE